MCKVNGEVLGSQYPELNDNFDRIQVALEHEVEVAKQLEVGGRAALPKIAQACPPLAGMIDPSDAVLFQEALQVSHKYDVSQAFFCAFLKKLN